MDHSEEMFSLNPSKSNTNFSVISEETNKMDRDLTSSYEGEKSQIQGILWYKGSGSWILLGLGDQ